MSYVFGEITVATSNTDRVVFPDCGITKGDVIAYYHDVADVMLPELRGRPLTIERFTKGIDKGGFFQKHAQKHYPAWIAREGGRTGVRADRARLDRDGDPWSALRARVAAVDEIVRGLDRLTGT